MQAKPISVPPAASQPTFQFGDFGLDLLPSGSQQDQPFQGLHSAPGSQGLRLPGSLTSGASSQTQAALPAAPLEVRSQAPSVPRRAPLQALQSRGMAASSQQPCATIWIIWQRFRPSGSAAKLGPCHY